MTFSYDLVTPTDVTRVRRHIGDTDQTTAMFPDEEIQFILDEEGSVGAAVIACIKTIKARLSMEPDMQADWLKVDWRRSAEGWNTLLEEKKQEFGLGWHSGDSAQHSYRPDSLQKTAPDYGEE